MTYRYTAIYYPKISLRFPEGALLHASADGNTTLCGKRIIRNWLIMSNDGKGKVTCPKCLRKVAA